jgi:hypothetical protein
LPRILQCYEYYEYAVCTIGIAKMLMLKDKKAFFQQATGFSDEFSIYFPLKRILYSI